MVRQFWLLMKDVLACSLFAVNQTKLPSLWLKSSPICSLLYPCPYVVPSPSITAPSSPITTDSINYRCAPSSVILMHPGKRAVLKTPSDECVEDCLGKPTWPRYPITVCLVWFAPIITLRESVLTTKLRQRFSAINCCTCNVNSPAGLRRNDDTR